MQSNYKQTISKILGEIPLTAEFYFQLKKQSEPGTRYSLKNIQARLPQMLADIDQFKTPNAHPEKILVFTSLHYWIEEAATIALYFAAQGHHVTFGYLPYSDWQNDVNKFDLRRQDLYTKKVFEQAAEYMDIVSFLPIHPSYKPIPDELKQIIEEVSRYDAQYTLQVEDVDKEHPLYKMRLERNESFARMLYPWLSANKPDHMIIPNGTIQEMGIAYRMAKWLKIPVVTYEFGEQRKRIWIAQNREVMRQETDDLWEVRKNIPVETEELKKVKAMFSARQHADIWENFTRRWQGSDRVGTEKIKQELKLDDRPIVFMATNVLGDSLTLGRQTFSRNMAEWIERTVQYFVERTDSQLVIRVHPGEQLTHGTSMVDVVHDLLPRLPEHIHLITPTDKTNSYDLVDVATVGLVYTTTMGLEMAMNGVPVIVAGQTHYRGRGFTYDPDNWVNYYKILGSILDDPQKSILTEEQVKLAWTYAYTFFFDYPRPFPWHLVKMWDDYDKRPFSYVLSKEGQAEYKSSFDYLIGKPMDWKKILAEKKNETDVE
ncbi:MAG TPA: hypothetical protein PLX12_01715 [Flexilinea sp.]|jgi:hypothetical protein|nr:hypothetical protein [Flexilinea sp.]HOR55290.1 hypothetical protein [Flexilinea sp.]HOU18619.1 hypothetical protein [Flexilinea sp.]HPL56701.1 hypothetical protein [Flexilinea sp.]HQF79373.1 hypothetical protein [Flexilinea sp.]